MNARLIEVNKIISGCVFKYGPQDHVNRTLRDATIGFTSLFDFNDIYEHEYRITHYFNSIEEQKKLLGPVTPFNRQRDFIDEFLRSIKLSCFSHIPTNNLMWSHYADHHKGVTYCFEKSSFLGKEFAWGNVTYSSTIPEIPIFQDKTTEGMLRAQLATVILTKSSEWAFEKEVRFYRRQEENYCKFHPDGLKAVIVGRRASDADIANVEAEIATFNAAHRTDCRLLYATRIAGSYNLGIEQSAQLREGMEGNFGAGIPVREDLDTPLVTMELASEETDEK